MRSKLDKLEGVIIRSKHCLYILKTNKQRLKIPLIFIACQKTTTA